MKKSQARSEREAQEVRGRAPAWLNVDVLPWWFWAGAALAFAVRGVYLLLDAQGFGDVLTALGLLLLVVPSQLLMARQRWTDRPPAAGL